MPVPVERVEQKPLDNLATTPLAHLDRAARATTRTRIIVIVVVRVDGVVRMQVGVVVVVRLLAGMATPTAACEGGVLLEVRVVAAQEGGVGVVRVAGVT